MPGGSTSRRVLRASITGQYRESGPWTSLSRRTGVNESELNTVKQIFREAMGHLPTDVALTKQATQILRRDVAEIKNDLRNGAKMFVKLEDGMSALEEARKKDGEELQSQTGKIQGLDNRVTVLETDKTWVRWLMVVVGAGTGSAALSLLKFMLTGSFF